MTCLLLDSGLFPISMGPEQKNRRVMPSFLTLSRQFMLTKGWVYNILTTQTSCPSFIHTLSCYKQPPFVQPKSKCMLQHCHSGGCPERKRPCKPWKWLRQSSREFQSSLPRAWSKRESMGSRWVCGPDLWTPCPLERNAIKESQGIACYSTGSRAGHLVAQLWV